MLQVQGMNERSLQQTYSTCRCQASFEWFYSAGTETFRYNYDELFRDTDGLYVADGVKVLECRGDYYPGRVQDFLPIFGPDYNRGDDEELEAENREERGGVSTPGQQNGYFNFKPIFETHVDEEEEEEDDDQEDGAGAVAGGTSYFKPIFGGFRRLLQGTDEGEERVLSNIFLRASRMRRRQRRPPVSVR